MAPRKRARTSGGSLTGGSGDVKPQILTLNTTPGNLDFYMVEQQTLPISRVGTIGTEPGTAQVFEILSVDWYLGIQDQSDAINTKFATLSTTDLGHTILDPSTLLSITGDLANPRSFAGAVKQTATFGVSGTSTWELPIHIDMTDNNGNGFLVATDNIFAIAGGVSDTVVGAAVAKIKYRLTLVDVMEFIGIVQGQQSG